MTKLFKNSKSVLSVALALAVLAVSLFTGVVINTEAACSSSEGVISVLEFIRDGSVPNVYYDETLADNGETGEDWDHAIIIDSARELSYFARYAGDETKGKYYKVADGIKGFDMSGGTQNPAGVINLDGTLDENLAKITGSGKNHNGTAYFQGHFDGNGATVYGLWNNDTEGQICSAAGLFPQAKGNVTIKNINVSLSHIKAKNHAGGIVGLYTLNRDFANLSDNGLTIENCSVTDSHIETTQTGVVDMTSAVGAIYGAARCYSGDFNGSILVNNCFINLDAAHLVSAAVSSVVDKTTDASIHGGIGGVAVTTAAKFTNCVVIGITPYSTFNAGYQGNEIQHTGPAAKYTNIYTDAVVGSAVDIGYNNRLQDYTTCMTQLSADQMKGDAAIANMNLDWNVWLANPNGYPEFRSAHKSAALNDNHDGTHSVTCECGVYGAPSAHEFVDGVCECGALLSCATRKTIYWDGTTATGLDTFEQKDGVYIINKASELAYIVTAAPDVTQGKTFKVADDIGNIVLQKKEHDNGIMQLSGHDEVKAYFEDSKNTKTNWVATFTRDNDNGGNPLITNNVFAGTFDGNGVTIYGMCGNADTGRTDGSLFGTTAVGAVIKNLAVRNSYVKSGWYGAIISGAITRLSTVSGEGVGIITYENIEISGCQIVANSGVAPYPQDMALLYGRQNGGGANVAINNLLVYDNEMYHLKDNQPHTQLVGNASWNNADTSIKNSVVLDCAVSYNAGGKTPFYMSEQVVENVYSSYADDSVNAKITIINNADAMGEAAADLNLDWSAWMVNANGYPALRVAHDDVLSAVPYADDNYAGHVEACSCGLASSVVEHDYDENYYCAVCDFTCDHRSNDHITMTPIEGDCLTATTMMGVCDCGFTRTAPAEAPGHDFSAGVVGEVSSDCQTQGTQAYKYCPNCDKKYAADADNMAAFDTAFTDETIKLPLGDHTHAVDDKGTPVYQVTDAGHQKICGVCSAAYGEVESHNGTPVDNGDGTHAITCTVAGCGYAEESAPHVFGDDNKCDICEYECTAHDYVDGETIELTFEQKYGEDSELYKDICYYVEQICSICGTKGENKPIAHTPGEWETPMYANSQPACSGEGWHTEVLTCTECFYQIDEKTVTDPEVGHQFEDIAEVAPTCSSTGTIAHKYCSACWGRYAADAADNEPYENALDQWSDEMDIPVDPEAHAWVDYDSTATCDKDGIAAHKFCSECGLFMVNGEETDVVFDYDKFMERDEDTYEAIGIGAKLEDNYNKIEAEAFAEWLAENYADQGFELVAYPENPEDYEAMDAYYAAMWEVEMALYELDENWREAWGEYQMAAWAQAQVDAMYEYLLAEAEATGVDMTAEATGHTLVKVDEVPATYDAEGTKAHYACECGKLYSDAEGKNEVTAESLVIAKLVKVEENKPSTDNETEGDKSDKSPATGENVASVAAVAALMGAAFVLVRKARKA